MSEKNGEILAANALERLSIPEISLLLDSACGARNMALLLSVPSDALITGKTVDEAFAAQLEKTGTPPQLPRGYCDKVLHDTPEDLVVTTEVDRSLSGHSRYYNISAFAAEKCLPYIGLVYKLCRDHDVAPTHLTGNRQTLKDPDAPTPNFVRLAIYALLLDASKKEEPSVSIADLARLANLPNRTIHNHLPSLLESGIVTGSSDGRRSEYPTYTLADINLDAQVLKAEGSEIKHRLANRIQQLIATGIISGDSIDVRNVHSYLVASDEIVEFTRSHQVGKQNEYIHDALVLLGSNGILKRDTPGHERTTHISLSEKGAVVAEKYLEIATASILQDPATIAVGRRIAQEAAKDPEAISWLLTVDFEKGAITRRKSIDERGQDVIDLLVKNRELTASQVMEMLDLKRRAASNTLKYLEQSGKIIGQRIGRQILWSLQIEPV